MPPNPHPSAALVEALYQAICIQEGETDYLMPAGYKEKLRDYAQRLVLRPPLATLIETQAARLEALEGALEPFGEEASMWGDLVPDDHSPLCVEMGHTNGAYYGSPAKYTVGDLRKACALLSEKTR